MTHDTVMENRWLVVLNCAPHFVVTIEGNCPSFKGCGCGPHSPYNDCPWVGWSHLFESNYKIGSISMRSSEACRGRCLDATSDRIIRFLPAFRDLSWGYSDKDSLIERAGYTEDIHHRDLPRCCKSRTSRWSLPSKFTSASKLHRWDSRG